MLQSVALEIVQSNRFLEMLGETWRVCNMSDFVCKQYVLINKWRRNAKEIGGPGHEIIAG